MTTMSSFNKINGRAAMDRTLKTAGLIVLVGSLYALVIAVLWLGQSHAGGNAIVGIFAIDTVQSWWYVTRAAGLTSYILLWLSTVWGLAIPTRILAPAVEGTYSYDFHEFLSLLGLGFVVLHILVLALDKYMPFSVLQLLIPFIDTYRPLWVGLGIIAFYLFLLVTLTFYMRKSIGTRAFRGIHALSLVGYLGATLHGFFAGTDLALAAPRHDVPRNFLRGALPDGILAGLEKSKQPYRRKR